MKGLPSVSHPSPFLGGFRGGETVENSALSATVADFILQEFLLLFLLPHTLPAQQSGHSLRGTLGLPCHPPSVSVPGVCRLAKLELAILKSLP